MKVFRKTLEYKTNGQFHFVDVTDDISSFVEECEARDGLVHVYCPHTTVAIKINESEEGFTLDFKDFISELVPKTRHYRHNDLDVRDEKTLCEDISLCINGDSHIIQMLIGNASETIPLVNGKLALGTWQRIFLIEVDKPRPRRLEISIMTAQSVNIGDKPDINSSSEKPKSVKHIQKKENISNHPSVSGSVLS